MHGSEWASRHLGRLLTGHSLLQHGSMPCLLEVYLVSGVDGLHGDAALIFKLAGLALHNGIELAAAAQPAVRERSHCETPRHAQKGNTVTTAIMKGVDGSYGNDCKRFTRQSRYGQHRLEWWKCRSITGINYLAKSDEHYGIGNAEDLAKPLMAM